MEGLVVGHTAILAWSLVVGVSVAGSWNYVVPAPGEPFEHPPVKALALVDAKPADLQEKVHYRGARRQYARLRYGSPDSLDVAVVLDRILPAEADIYVDADRNRVIEPKERVAGEKRTWRMPLDMAIVQGEKAKLIPRKVVFRLSRIGRTLRFAACGYLRGKVRVGDRECELRRTDGDGNGFFADAQDLLWIDLDGNGRWDGIDEQYLYAPILILDGRRYAVRSDGLGEHLALDEIQGSGIAKLALSQDTAERVAEVTATLVGRDGSVVGLRRNGAEATVPVGQYRLSAVSVSLKDPEKGQPWNYVFTDRNRHGAPVWYKIAKGTSVAIDPIGELALEAVLIDSDGVCRAGDKVRVKPSLHTTDGLVIAVIYRGETTSREARDRFRGEMRLVAPAGEVLGKASTGFG